MATKTKTAAKTAAKKALPTERVAPTKKSAATTPTLKSLKDTFTKVGLMSHLAEQATADAKAVKVVLLHLENAIVVSLHKKGTGEFTLPGLLKVTSAKVPATKRRFDKSPFTGMDRWFEAKSVAARVKVRALKKVKDAATSSRSAA